MSPGLGNSRSLKLFGPAAAAAVILLARWQTEGSPLSISSHFSQWLTFNRSAGSRGSGVGVLELESSGVEFTQAGLAILPSHDSLYIAACHSHKSHHTHSPGFKLSFLADLCAS